MFKSKANTAVSIGQDYRTLRFITIFKYAPQLSKDDITLESQQSVQSEGQEYIQENLSLNQAMSGNQFASTFFVANCGAYIFK